MAHHTLFISDLHLSSSYPQIVSIFLQFLTNQGRQADALYILGDLFEYWVGDDESSELADTIKKALKQLVDNGTPVFFIHGNRDFLLGKTFAQATGCQLLPDPCKIELYGKPALLMHGDTLCTEDVKYLKFRKYARNPCLQFLFRHLPLSLRQKLADEVRKRSHLHVSNTKHQIMDVTPATVAKTMLQHEVKLLIHGHTHRPNIHPLILHEHAAYRIVLDAWHEHGNMLVYDENHHFELSNFT